MSIAFFLLCREMPVTYRPASLLAGAQFVGLAGGDDLCFIPSKRWIIHLVTRITRLMDQHGVANWRHKHRSAAGIAFSDTAWNPRVSFGLSLRLYPVQDSTDTILIS